MKRKEIKKKKEIRKKRKMKVKEMVVQRAEMSKMKMNLTKVKTAAWNCTSSLSIRHL